MRGNCFWKTYLSVGDLLKVKKAFFPCQNPPTSSCMYMDLYRFISYLTTGLSVSLSIMKSYRYLAAARKIHGFFIMFFCNFWTKSPENRKLEQLCRCHVKFLIFNFDGLQIPAVGMI